MSGSIKDIVKDATDPGVDCFDRFCTFCTFCIFSIFCTFCKCGYARTMIGPGSHKKENEGALTQSNNRTANKEPAWLMSLRSLFENLLEVLNIIGNLLLHTGVDQL